MLFRSMVRHHPQWKWILETIASGQIGKVRAIQAHSCLMLPAGNTGTGLPGEGSLLLDIGCYSVHLVRTIAGAEPRQISARMEFAANTQRDNLIRADLTFDGCYAQIFVASTMRPARRIHVLGTEGSIEVMNPIHPSPDGTSPVRLTNAAGVSEKSFPRAPQYALQFQDFSMAVNEQRAPLVTLADALANAKALDAIRASAKAGGATVGV